MSVTAAEVERDIRALPDPEIPVVTLSDLGIVRSIEVDAERQIVSVTLTPTYSGCPATHVIERQVVHVIAAAGWTPDVVTTLSPPWTTDWITDAGKDKLRRFGIAPPQHSTQLGPQAVSLGVRIVQCPQCASSNTEELSRFGSTACKALRRCLDCLEPFDEFKALV